MTYAVMQKNPEPPTMEQLRRAFQKVPGLTAADAAVLCKDLSGIVVRNLASAEQGMALQSGLRAEGIETEVVEESRLPVLPPGKFVRQLELTSEALVVFDPIGRKLPVPWAHLLLIAAGGVQQVKFQRAREEREVVRSVNVGLLFPIRVHETKLEYNTREVAEWSLHVEIILTRAAMRFTIEAESFNFRCLGERVGKDRAGNLCLLVRELAKHAPQAVLGRGATALVAEPPQIVNYARKNSISDEITWLLWQMPDASTKG